MDLIDPYCSVNSLGTANVLLKSFITSIFALHCNISSSTNWPADYGESVVHYGIDEFDYIVVGAGSAGSVVAGRLAENIHNRVLLVEAGGDPPMETEIPGLTWTLLDTHIVKYYATESNRRSCLASKGDYCSFQTGEALGGTHSTNALSYVRGFYHDYENWLRAGNPTWGWEDLLYYFKKTEKFRGKDPYNLHGTDGPLTVEEFRSPNIDNDLIMKAAKELGHTMVDDFSAGPNVGFGRVFGTLKNGRSMTTAKAFLTNNRPNLFIMKHAVARKIKFDHDLRAKGVSIVYKDRYLIDVRARKEIILSAGSIGTPKLLMLSGVGPKIHLQALGIPVKKDLDVGENLQDHARVLLFLRLKDAKDVDPTTEFLDAFYDQWVHRKGAYGAAFTDYYGYIATDGNPDVPDIQTHGIYFNNITSVTAPLKDHIGQSIEKEITPYDKLIVFSVLLLKPKSRGFLKLRSTDYRDDPLIYPEYLQKKDDVRTLVRGIEAVIDFERTNAFSKLNGEFLRPYLPECDVYEYRSQKYWECYVRHMTTTSYGYVGTSKMGPKQDRSSVVNSELKVHGVKRLRVIDASIMPTIVSANPNAATIMIGEKGADFVKLSEHLRS